MNWIKDHVGTEVGSHPQLLLLPPLRSFHGLEPPINSNMILKYGHPEILTFLGKGRVDHPNKPTIPVNSTG
jgi:hypothetical protein